MVRLLATALFVSLLAACASDPAPANPYGSADEQRQRAGKATQELGGY